MMRTNRFVRLALLLTAAMAVSLYAQPAGKRLALIIGNNAYPASPLQNAVNDAHSMEKALATAGFQTRVVENAKKADMEAAIGEFLDKIGPDDVALFFYAGHGVQIESENFLVPVDFPQAGTISAAKFACMSVAQIFDELKHKRPKQSIVILDACRTNPITAKYSLAAGLAKPQDMPKEAYVVFSTGPGQVASDNPDGRNSWFTEALADFISQPAMTVEIEEMLKRVSKRVSDATEGRQVPYKESSLTGTFYFHPPANDDSDVDPNLMQKWMDDATLHEQHGEWPNAIELVGRIVQRKPGGAVEELAKRKLPYLTARRDAQAKFDAGEYADAAALYEKAIKADPFAGEAILLAVDSYLLLDQLPPSVALLGALRQRGTADGVERAELMLKQLATVSPEAAKEAQTPTPQPPPIGELFSSTTFGTPDWDAGKRRLDNAAVDISAYTKDLKMEVAMPLLVVPPPAAGAQEAPAAGPAQAAAPADANAAALAAAIFHIDVVQVAGATRNLKLRTGAAEEFGYLVLDGVSKDTPVLLDSKEVAPSGKLKLAVGKYEVRTMEGGKVVGSQPVEVKPLSIETFKVSAK